LEGHSSIVLGSIYLKKFLVTSHGVIMRLSNGLVQVYFKDTTELFFEKENHFVTYLNKEGERETLPRKLALE